MDSFEAMIGSAAIIFATAKLLKVILDCFSWCYDVAKDEDDPIPEAVRHLYS